MMKAFVQIPAAIVFIAIAGILFYFGPGFIGQASFTGTIDGCVPQQGEMVIPIMGYYECKDMPDDRTYNTAYPNTWWRCGAGEYTNKCDIQIECPTTETWFLGLLESNMRLWYKKCVDGPDCYLDKYVLNVQDCSPGSIFHNMEIDRGEQIYLEFQLQDFWGNWYTVPDSKVNFYNSYTPYGLWLESRTGASGFSNLQGCFVTTGYQNVYDKDGNWLDSTTVIGTVDRVGELDFGHATNFLEAWVSAPTDYNIVDHPTYGQVYCAGTSVYDIGTILLSNGCYAYPESRRAAVECCPGQSAAQADCVDFKWVQDPQAQIQCISDIACKGQGNYITDYTDPTRTTLTVGNCIDSLCVYSSVNVECASTEACPHGEVCVINQELGTGTCKTQEAVGVLPPREVIGESTGTFDLFGNLLGYLTMFIFALILSTILVGVLYTIPFTRAIFGIFFKNPKTMVGIIILMALVLTVLFAAPMASFAAMII